MAGFERSRSLFLIQSLRALGFLFFGVSAWLLEINTVIPLLKTLPDRETPRDFCFGLFSPATLNKCRAPTVPNPSRRETPREFSEFQSRIAFSARSEIGGLNTSIFDNGSPKSQNLIDRERRMAKTRVLMQLKLKSYRLQ